MTDAELYQRAEAALATLNAVLVEGGRHGAPLTFASKGLYASKSYLKVRRQAVAAAEHEGTPCEIAFDGPRLGAWKMRPRGAILFERVEGDGTSTFPAWRVEGSVLSY